MRALKFIKMQGSGNDFIVIDGRRQIPAISHPLLAKKTCDRRYGVGADGLLLLEKSGKADIRMRIFNADGSEAEMCGNGVRCCALYLSKKEKKRNLDIETKAGILSAEVSGEEIKVKMTEPSDLKLDMRVCVADKEYEVDYINTGVPHAVIEVNDLKAAPVKSIGRLIRHHQVFLPAGTNVDFIKIESKDHILLRTYERGVEDETLACGTGSVASAIIATLNHSWDGSGQKRSAEVRKVYVKTQSEEVLCVYFKISKKKIFDVWLEGKAKIVFEGEYFI